VPTGDEYVMNTDPTNGLSYRRVTEVRLRENGYTLTWPCATDRLYDVEYDLSTPSDGWAPMEGLTNLTPNIEWLIITNTLDDSAIKFYRLKVRLP